MPVISSPPLLSLGFTWRPNPVPEAQSFAAMRTALAKGANAWNGGEFYGTPEYNSLHLLNHYFTKHPEDANKVHLCIKGVANQHTYMPEGDRKGVRRSVETCVKLLGGKKKIDCFESARVDPKVPIEETIGHLAECVKEGLIGGISLSEVKAESIRRAAKVHKIEAVEVEFSMFSTEILTNGVAEACAELGIPIL